MVFLYTILFFTQDGREIERCGEGLFYPTDMKVLKLEDMLWQMAEMYGRPKDVEIHLAFKSGEIEDGTRTTKRIEAPKTAS